ncbi:hypothetical protein E7T09_07990 [Deinococcus sp. KSM4-11]|uniref:hypothetical protein n=1 Tax=Deinococcus sp. KSM4-11 TaxID=2568654 RepID=UPI0010A35D15|nr:hypothetical protein [Deinococcus sp. KSM4-11]THF87098.1 hypothetical protein E7T09_07990 [Deinococcus sp. KSM4-11]
MRVSVPLRSTKRTAIRPQTSGLLALVAVALLSGCSQQAPSVPTATAVAATEATTPTPVSATPAPQPTAATPFTLTSSTRELSLKQWSVSSLPITTTGGGGPVTLRMERADGDTGDVIEVSPSTFTPGAAPAALKLRPTKVAFPAPEDAAPWKLVASQGGKDVASVDLNVVLQTANLTFTLQPVTAAEGQTVDAVLVVDADAHDLPGFTFSLSPYIPDESESYELAGNPATTYTVTSLPATFHVPITFKAFHGDEVTRTAGFQLSVDGLSDTLGSNRYLGKYVRANLTWNLAR